MARDAYFERGVEYFRQGTYQDALAMFNEAKRCGKTSRQLFDSRAAVLEKLNRPQEALRDCRKVIEISPTTWTGYARAARLFLKINKPDKSLKMADLALERLKTADTLHRDELLTLRSSAIDASAAQARRATRRAYHFGKLPTELCNTIFAYTADKEDASKIVVLSLVCRHWRNVALNAPELWRTLVLTPKSPARKVDAWMQRSRGMLFSLEMRSGFSYRMRPDMMRYVSTLNWERLETLKIEILSTTESLVDVLPYDAFKRMRPLDFTVSTPLYNPDPARGPMNTGQFWNALGAINFSRLCTLAFVFIPVVPWDRLHGVTTLRNLTIQGAHFSLPDAIPLLLANAPELEHLTLDSSRKNPGVDNHFPLPPLSFPRLTHVAFRQPDPRAAVHMCEVDAPHVESLHIEYALHSPSYFGALMRTPRVTLTELRLRRCLVQDDALLCLLRGTPRLVSLSLDQCLLENVNKIIEVLAGPSRTMIPAEVEREITINAQFLCPLLQHIDLSNSADLQASPVVQLVKAHLQEPVHDPTSPQESLPVGGTVSAVAPLRSLVLDACPNISADVLPWLRSKVERVSCVYMTRKHSRKTYR